MWYFKNGSHSKTLNLDRTQNDSGANGLFKKCSTVITKNVSTQEKEERKHHWTPVVPVHLSAWWFADLVLTSSM